MSGDRVWLQISWEQEGIAPPANWPMKPGRNGPEPCVRIWQLTLAGGGNSTVRECKPAGRDAIGKKLWKPKGKQLPAFSFLRDISESGASVYLYPHRPDPSKGVSNNHCDGSTLLFYEADGTSLEEQRAEIEKLKQSGLQPAAVLFSGGKSLHVYFKLSEKATEADRLRLSRKLCILHNSDPAVCNAARAMRLAGMARLKGGELKEVALEESCQRVYALSEVEAIIDDFGLFPHGLGEGRWREWVKRSGKPELGDPIDALLKPDAELFPPRAPKPQSFNSESADFYREFWEMVEGMAVEDLYTHDPQGWKIESRNDKRCGSPWYESQSRTSFSVEIASGCWYEFNHTVGGYPQQYLAKVWRGDPYAPVPCEQEFIKFSEWVADRLNIAIPDERRYQEKPKKSKGKASSKKTTEAAGDSSNDEENEEPKLATSYCQFLALVGDRLRRNALTKDFELDGTPMDLERLELQLALEGLQFYRLETVAKCVAEENEYSPVAEYLESLPSVADTSILDSIASRYLGRDEPIFNTFLRKWMISAIARALEPGCKCDTSLILQGQQGIGKSTFFKVLAGPWFDDSMGAMSDKDEKLKMHRAWIVEWAELETVFRRKDISAIKSFLSSNTDYLRLPYGRTVEELKRHSVIVASTNQNEFLSDPTGNRRFWVVPVKGVIDVAALERDRDALWAAAVAAYNAGEQWWLSATESTQASLIAEEYRMRDPWEAPIEEWIDSLAITTTTASKILTDGLKIDVGRQSRGEEMRVTAILQKWGWEQKTRQFEGKRRRVWVAPLDEVVTQAKNAETTQQQAFTADSQSQPSQPRSKVVTEVVTPETTQQQGLQPHNHNRHNLSSKQREKTEPGHTPPPNEVNASARSQDESTVSRQKVVQVVTHPQKRGTASDSAVTTPVTTAIAGCDSQGEVVTIAQIYAYGKWQHGKVIRKRDGLHKAAFSPGLLDKYEVRIGDEILSVAADAIRYEEAQPA